MMTCSPNETEPTVQPQQNFGCFSNQNQRW